MRHTRLLFFRNGSYLHAVLVVLVLLSACKRKPIPEPRENEDPYNKANAARIEKGKILQFSSVELSKETFTQEPFERKKPEDEGEIRPTEKIHPVLKKWLEERPSEQNERMLVNFRDDLRLPRFPEPATDQPRESAINKRALARAQELIRQMEERRSSNYQKLREELGSRYQAQVLETYWLINGVAVEMPLRAVQALAAREDVLYVEPQNAGEQPPQDANNNNDVDDGRARLVSDPYFDLGLTGGWIGLLDTGLRFTHTQFNNPSHIDFRRDCVSGGADCNTGAGLNPNDDCWNHGTSSAAIITANGNQGNAYRGVTGIILDSFKVYPNSCGGLDAGAAVRGFQAAVAVLDRVIVAEMQGGGDDRSSISTAADHAFDCGAVVIAANGNNGPAASTVNAPANAHKVIGVGNFDLQTQTQITSQSRGPAPDNRYKPDIQAPTNTETASNASDTALRIFGGTSCATPFAAGAAALLRNWLRGASFSIDPGQVYAQVILSGQQPYPFNNTSGAGPLRLPTDGWAWWGKVAVGNGVTINIPLTLGGASPNNLDGALWWPETPSQAHNDIDLYLVDPGNNERDLSVSIPSVFERAHVGGAVAAGTWTLRIRGYHVPTGTQSVYWSAHVRVH